MTGQSTRLIVALLTLTPALACFSASSGGGGGGSSEPSSSSGGSVSFGGDSGSGSGGTASDAGGPCAYVTSPGTQWITTTVSCPAGGTSSFPMSLTLTLGNPTSHAVTIESVSAKWIDGTPSPEPAWCGLSNSVTWTLSGMTIPADATGQMLTLQATETCSGWSAMSSGQCAQQLEIDLETSCGTLQAITMPITLNIGG